MFPDIDVITADVRQTTEYPANSLRYGDGVETHATAADNGLECGVWVLCVDIDAVSENTTSPAAIGTGNTNFIRVWHNDVWRMCA